MFRLPSGSPRLLPIIALPFAWLCCNGQNGASPSVPPLLSLPSATEIMLKANPLLLRERQSLPIAQSSVVAASKRPNPEIDANSESYPIFDSNPGSFLNNQELSFRAGQTFETAGKRRKRVAVAKEGVAIAGASVDDTLRQLKLELKRRFYAVVLAKAQSDLAQQMLDQFDQIIAVTEARYKQGEVSGLEINRTRAERARFFNDLVDANLQLKNSKVALLEILGASDLAAQFELQETLKFEAKAIDIGQLQREAMDTRPDMTAARYAVERGSRILDLERANAKPDVTATFGYKRDFGANTPIFGVSSPLPLFNRNQAGVARARAETEQQRQEMSRISLAIGTEVQQAAQAVNANADKVKALQDDYVPSAKRSLEIAQQSFRLGSLDLIGLLDSERTYRETLRNYNQALYDYKAANFELEAAVGKEF